MQAQDAELGDVPPADVLLAGYFRNQGWLPDAPARNDTAPAPEEEWKPPMEEFTE